MLTSWANGFQFARIKQPACSWGLCIYESGVSRPFTSAPSPWQSGNVSGIVKRSADRVSCFQRNGLNAAGVGDALFRLTLPRGLIALGSHTYASSPSESTNTIGLDSRLCVHPNLVPVSILISPLIRSVIPFWTVQPVFTWACKIWWPVITIS